MSSNIVVAVRVRPLSAKEGARGDWSCLVCQDGKQINCNDPDEKMGGLDYLRLDKTKDKQFAFDHAFDPGVPQGAVFEGTSKAVIPDVMRGGNACVFAYGATGSGKTYTMMGAAQSPGVVLLTTDCLFSAIADAAEEHSVVVRMTYVEIYNENVRDLLEPSNAPPGGLDVREAPGKGTFVAGATSIVVSSRAELEASIHKGNLYRTTEATNVNEVSSRSHAVIQLRVERTPRFDASAQTLVGKLSMIDLAGSERAAKTGNKGKRLNEGANINRSLLALGNCINALADKTKRNGHVPYRDSKLTRLLKDSLGGHCKTVMIANLSPSSDQFDETLNSLKYANRAKNIQTKEVVVTVQRPQPQVHEQLAMVRELRNTVRAQQQQARPQTAPGGGKNGRRAKGGGARGPAGTPAAGIGQAVGGGGARPQTAPSPERQRGSADSGFAGVSGSDSEAVDETFLLADALKGKVGRQGRASATAARLWQTVAQNASFVEAHNVLDKLERDVVLELQMELASLLAERTQLQEARMHDGVGRWRTLLRTTALSRDSHAPMPPEPAEDVALREELGANRAALVRARGAMLAGCPTDERSATAAVIWENSMLRAEAHARQHAVLQLKGQLDELAAMVGTDGWPAHRTAPLLSELGRHATILSAEQAEAMAAIEPSAEAKGATSGKAGHHDGSSAHRHHYLAQLVPSMLRHSSSRFGAVVRETRDLLGRHRRERERLCAELRLVEEAPPSPGREGSDENDPRSRREKDVSKRPKKSARIEAPVTRSAAARAGEATSPLAELTNSPEPPMAARQSSHLEKLKRGISQRFSRISGSFKELGASLGESARSGSRSGSPSQRGVPSQRGDTVAWGDPSSFKQWAERGMQGSPSSKPPLMEGSPNRGPIGHTRV